jgi:hypothetical protein
MPALEIVSLLERAAANCGRFVPRSEIISAVQNSLGCAWQPGNQAQPIHAAPKWPAVNHEQREAIIRDGGALVDLWEASPARFDDNDAHTEALIDALFPGNPLLCCGLSNSDFDTRLRSEWRGKLSTLQLIVPSPMTARSGLTQDGRKSAHALSITGQRRFLVVEFDQGDVDDHAALLWHMALKAPLAMVCPFWIEVFAWLVLLCRATGRTFAPGHALLRFVRRRPGNMESKSIRANARRHTGQRQAPSRFLFQPGGARQMRREIASGWTDGTTGDWQIPGDSAETNKATAAPVDADEETLQQLAALSVLEYERKRKAEAERLGWRITILDELVANRRPPSVSATGELQGRTLNLPDVEPWPEPVNGAEV